MGPSLPAKVAILMALYEGPGHGQAIVKRIVRAGDIVLGDGSVYPALVALEKARFVRSLDSKPAEGAGGRPRTMYALTPKGRESAVGHAKTVAALAALVLGRPVEEPLPRLAVVPPLPSQEPETPEPAGRVVELDADQPAEPVMDQRARRKR